MFFCCITNLFFPRTKGLRSRSGTYVKGFIRTTFSRHLIIFDVHQFSHTKIELIHRPLKNFFNFTETQGLSTHLSVS